MTNNQYAFQVEYTPTSKSDAETWDVVANANSPESALAEMERRYPAHVEPDASYRFFSIPLSVVKNPIEIVVE